jgi:hypothetical protein
MSTYSEPSASPPDESPLDGSLSGEDKAAEEDSAVAGSSSAAARVVVRPPLPRCDRSASSSPALSESRTTGRGVSRRPVGFVDSDAEALAEGPGASTGVGPVDTSSASTVSVTSFAVFFGIRPVAVLVDITGAETSTVPVSGTVGASAGPRAATRAGVGLVVGAGEPTGARALLMPSPIAATRSAVTVTGLSGGMSLAGVGSQGGMVRS